MYTHMHTHHLYIMTALWKNMDIRARLHDHTHIHHLYIMTALWKNMDIRARLHDHTHMHTYMHNPLNLDIHHY